MVMGTERPVLEHAKTLILRYTLFEQPLPNVVALTAQVHNVWDAAVANIADAKKKRKKNGTLRAVHKFGKWTQADVTRRRMQY